MIRTLLWMTAETTMNSKNEFNKTISEQQQSMNNKNERFIVTATLQSSTQQQNTRGR